MDRVNLDRQEILMRAWPENRQRVVAELFHQQYKASRIQVIPIPELSTRVGIGDVMSDSATIEQFILTLEWRRNARGRYARVVCEDFLVGLL